MSLQMPYRGVKWSKVLSHQVRSILAKNSSIVSWGRGSGGVRGGVSAAPMNPIDQAEIMCLGTQVPDSSSSWVGRHPQTGQSAVGSGSSLWAMLLTPRQNGQ